MGNIFYFDWEISLMAWLQTNLSGIGKPLSRFFTFMGEEVMCFLVVIILLFCYRKEIGKRVAIPLMLASAWFSMVKNVVLRVRPYMVETDPKIEVWKVPESDADPMDIVQQGYSCPSGHATMTMAMYGSMSMELRKRWMWFLSIALVVLIGISRFIVGVHYPTDVLAGWVLGLLAIGLGKLLDKKVQKEWVRYAIILAVTLPGIFYCKSRDYFSAIGMIIGLSAGFLYEAKYVQFQDTRNVWAMILRVVGALAIYYGLNTLLKLPFDKEWLNSGTMGPNLVRAARYVVVLFVVSGLFPKCFSVFEKIGKK